MTGVLRSRKSKAPHEPECDLPEAKVQGGQTREPLSGGAITSKDGPVLDISLGQSYAGLLVEGNPPGEGEGVPGGVPEGSCAHALLGNNGRTPATPFPQGFSGCQEGQNLLEEVDPETGEIVRYEVTDKGRRRVLKSSQQLRAERYALKSVVNRLYSTSLTAKCGRMRVPRQDVRILKAPEFQKAFYSGLSRCASVWLCPNCAAKIAERRRAELVAAVAVAKAMGWQVMLMTCTIPHGLGDDIKDMIAKMLKAWRKMTDDRKGKDMRKLFGVEGTIRAMEVTDGQNGFHPHFHVLLFIRSNFSPESVQAGFLPLWQDACVKVGLPCPSDYHGLRVDDGSWAARYASKWGLEDEMVKGHMKASRGVEGMTPWDLLRDVLLNRSNRSEARFRLYAEAFKGERQLYWSNGLKAKLAFEEATDAELVAQEPEHAYEFHKFTEDHWRAVLATKSEAALLDVVERNPEDFQAVMRGILKCYRLLLKLKQTM